jgi:hypothetical protein
MPMFNRGCVVLLVIVASACSKSDGPTTPTSAALLASGPASAALLASGETFQVSGFVTDDQGVPVVGANVTMAYWLGGNVRRPSVQTDASGGYTIGFTSNPWTIGTTGSRGAARAEVLADGYEWYWRTVLTTSPRPVENFRLYRIQRVTAGDSIVLSVTPDNGECTGWLAGPCGRVRVAAPADGNLTVEAVPTQVAAALPQIQVCCVSGDERYGNPVTLPVTAGSETWVEVGQQQPGVTASESVIVKTSLKPF